MIAVITSALVVSLLVWFFVWKQRYIKKLKQIRDDFDFTTPEGKFLIRAYNQKIDQLNGFKVWQKKNT